MSSLPSVSVVIPARDAAGHLASCLESIRRLAHEVDLVVVDDASSDDTAAIASAYGARLVRNATRLGPAESRNMGAAASSGEYIFFTDSDCEVSEGWILAGCESLSDPGVVAVEGAVHYARPDIRLYDKVPLNPFYNYNSRGVLTVGGQDFGAANLAVRRSAFTQASGFDSRSFPNGREDTDLAFRLMSAGRVATNRAMMVTHRESEWDSRSLAESSRRYAADVTFLARHGRFPYRMGPVLHPRFLAYLLFPPLMLVHFRPRTWRETAFLPKLYAYFFRARLSIWRAAVREAVWAM